MTLRVVPAVEASTARLSAAHAGAAPLIGAVVPGASYARGDAESSSYPVARGWQ